MSESTFPELETRIQLLGAELDGRIRGQHPGLFDRGFWEGKLLDWAMRDPAFKLDLFRLVDVLPTLNETAQVSQHVREYLLTPGRELPGVMSAALKAAAGGLTAGLAVAALRKNVADLAERFIVGHDARSALPTLRRLHGQGFAVTVDLLGEAVLSDAEADVTAARYLDLIDRLSTEVARWPGDDMIDRNHLGPIPRTNVSLKVSALAAHLDPVDSEGSIEMALRRVLPLFLRARERNVFINLDLEQWEFHGITYDLFERIATHPQLADWPHVGIVVQAYLKRAAADLARLAALAARRRAPITVRLVKGAYWDYEISHAAQHGFESPVFTTKSATDANYEALSRQLLEHVGRLLPAFGSHNLRSLTHALAQAEQRGVPQTAVEVQMLYGMAEPERAALRERGIRVRLYAPIGELLPGMAYLVRRLLENTANAGFLKLSHHDQVELSELLRAPSPEPDPTHEPARTCLGEKFDNCPFTDFTESSQRATFAVAVQRAAVATALIVPVVINGRNIPRPTLPRECPSDPTRVVAQVAQATIADVEAAVREAYQAWPNWRDRALEERAALLNRLAERLEADRHELAAVQVFEVAKPWREADAEVAEAVDFCRYYARHALTELAPRAQGSLPGEQNELRYQGRGPTAVIAPWNFPLAILCGMATAALVAGNPVLLKPAEQSSAIAYALFKRMQAAGFPPGAVHFLPGDGPTVGGALVGHPLVANIAFTGSKAVGLGLLERAARVQPGQPQLKRVVCEMGGKNAVVIDDDADLDEALIGVLRSAFGYAGQKCSACSRVIVVGSAYEPFVARLIEATRALQLAPAHEPRCQVPPVVDAEACARLRSVIAEPGPGAEPLFVAQTPAEGYFVPPALFAVTDPQHRLMQEEFFGPIVALMKVDSFDRALTVANAVEFKLTGAVFSRSPAHLEQARREFRVGNLYLNRGCTGALVHRQPFGGFGLSGGGTKAGGPGYLLHFVDPRVITENTMRRGMTPELEV